jgi:hypothetical protein
VPPLADAEIARLAMNAGLGSHEQVKIATAIALAESGGIPTRQGDNGFSIGLWQIHMPSHPQFSKGQLMIPAENAKAMMAVSEGGKTWRPWTVYKTGAYRAYLDRGQKAASEAFFGDVPSENAGLGGGGILSGITDSTLSVLAPAAKALELLGGALRSITDPAWWKRLGIGAAGVLVLIVAGVLLVRSLVVPEAMKVARQVAGG